MKTEFPVEQSEQAAKHDLELVVVTSQSAYGGPDTASPEHASLFTSTSTAYPKTHPAATRKRLRRCWQHANTIVPGGVQGLDRYNYANNSPINFADPSGHKACDGADLDGECDQSGTPTSVGQVKSALRSYGVRFSGHWDFEHLWAVYMAVYFVGSKLASNRGLGETDANAFKAVFKNGIKFTWETKAKMCGKDLTNNGGCTYGAQNISFWSMSGEGSLDFDRMIKNVVHELGHAFYRATGSKAMGNSFSRDALRPNENGVLDWQQHPGVDGTELFADTFIAWVYDAWNQDPKESIALAVDNAQNAMDNWMDE